MPLLVVDLETGQQTLLGDQAAEPGSWSTPRFSPDGQQVAAFGTRGDQTGIWVVEIGNGTFRLLTPGAPTMSAVGRQMYETEEPNNYLLQWATSDTIYFLGRAWTDVWAVAASGGEPELYAAIPFQCLAAEVIPEQHKVLCSEEHETSDVWVVEAEPPSR
jgi:Tol biopolymer transport system component